MIEQGVDDLPASVHQIQDSRRQPHGIDELEHFLHRHRYALRRLHHDRVPARNRIGDEPERNHPREIERRDHRTDAKRLADHDLVDAGRDVLGVVPLNQNRCAAGHVDVLDGATHLAARLGECLAAFDGDGA
jgi:hypothetical protein